MLDSIYAFDLAKAMIPRCLFAIAAALPATLPIVAEAQTSAPLNQFPWAGRPVVLGAPAGVTAFVGVNVVPMDTERVVTNQTVLIEGGRITALGPVNRIPVPASARRIDGQGKYLIPGLSDCHGHDQNFSESDKTKNRFFYLANGVTTVRVVDHEGARYDVRTLSPRTLAAEGKILSPRLYVGSSGNWPYGGVLGNRSGNNAESEDPNLIPKLRLDSIASHIAAFQAMGFDFIKIYYERGLVYDSVLAVARRLGIPAMGHVPLEGAQLEQAFRGRQASIEHLMGYNQPLLKGEPVRWGPEELIARLQGNLRLELASPESLAIQRQQIDLARIPALAAATARAGTWNCPTQLVFEPKGFEVRTDTMSFQPEIEYIAPAKREAWLREARRSAASKPYEVDLNGFPLSERNGTLEARRRLIRALQDSGAGLLVGSDQGGSFLLRAITLPGVAVHRELQLLVKAGLTPYEALAAGTRNMGIFVKTFFKAPDEIGIVAVGKRADLVLLTGNPLENIKHTMQPAGVMIGGRWLSRADIDRHLAAIWAGSFKGEE